MRDGPDGERGGLAILRMGGENGQALVMKNTKQGMGHGHFDKLNWLFYDNGQRVVTDYGSARFLNVEAKRGGIYLAENRSWAKQTIAHNTLVVDEKSHFNGDWKVGEEHAPTVRFFEAGKDTQVASATMRDAYPGVVFTRTQALLQHPDFTLKNPNRVRSLYMAFAGNPHAFHAASGEGYRMVADLILALDPLNAQTAARFVPPLGRWRRIEPGRAAIMRAELERIAGASGLSRDTFEQVTRSLD